MVSIQYYQYFSYCVPDVLQLSAITCIYCS